LPNGLLYLKGGILETEIKTLGSGEYRKSITGISVYPLSEYFSESFFTTKFLLHLFKSE
jgi:hypothetical protein